MPYNYEPGKVTHVNDAGAVDSEIQFLPPQGERAFQIISAYFTPGTNTQKIQNTMMQMVMDSMRASLWSVIDKVDGKPYRMQGNDPESGFDVGGLIQYIYNHIYGVSFPINVQKQWQTVDAVTVDTAMPGDLVFWGTELLITNAGVYLGGGCYITVDLLGDGVVIQPISSTWLPDFVGSLR